MQSIALKKKKTTPVEHWHMALTLSDSGTGELVSTDITLLQSMPRDEPKSVGWQLTQRNTTSD